MAMLEKLTSFSVPAGLVWTVSDGSVSYVYYKKIIVLSHGFLELVSLSGIVLGAAGHIIVVSYCSEGIGSVHPC